MNSLTRITESFCTITDESMLKILAFLFHGIDANTFSAYFKKEYGLHSRDCMRLRRTINEDGYILMNLKPYLFHCFQKDIYEQYVALAKNFQIRDDDSSLALYMHTEYILKQMKPLKNKSVPNPVNLMKKMHSMYPVLYQYTSKFVRKKMYFITQYNSSITVDDIVHDCIYKGYQNIMTTYPRIDNPLHAMNICKRAIHNYGINYISYMTRTLRGNLISTKDGYENRIISYSTLMQDRIADDDNELDDYFLKSSCKSIRRRYGGRKNEALKLLMGKYSESFSKWLLTNDKVAKSHRIPNDKLSDILYHRKNGVATYKKYVSSYLNVTPGKMEKFMRELSRYV